MTAEALPFDPAGIRAVAFDGYGTVIDFHTVEFRMAIVELLRQQGLEPNPDEFYNAWVELYRDAAPGGRDAAGDEIASGRLDGPLPEWHSTREIWQRQFALAFERFGFTGDPDAAAGYLSHLLSHAPPYADAREVLERLDRAGYRLGLLSNADEDFLQSALSGGRLRFSMIQSSESLRAYKPHRTVFLAACERLGCEPGALLYVGDSPYSDVQGAHAADLRTAWVRRDEATEYPERLPRPDMVVTSLTELADRLDAPPAAAGEAD